MVPRATRICVRVLTILFGLCIPALCLGADSNQWDIWQQQIDRWSTQGKLAHSRSKQALNKLKPDFERRLRELRAKGCDRGELNSYAGSIMGNSVILAPSDVTNPATFQRSLDERLAVFLRRLKSAKNELASLKAQDSKELSMLPAAQSEMANITGDSTAFFAQNYRTVLDVLETYWRIGMGVAVCD
ncbi:MAG: hypothetical protein ACRD2L_08460, partial [Terriglobia bacterium]